jgi:hypothetical protein
MPVAINETIIDILLLGQGDRQRQLQDLPIRAEIWTEIAAAPDPAEMHDLLITPEYEHTAARVANVLAKLTVGAPTGNAARRMSYLAGLVAARLSLEDIWSVLIPMTDWWLRITTIIGDAWNNALLRQHMARELDVAIGRETLEMLSPDELAAVRSLEREQDKLRNVERQLIRLGLLIGILRAAGQASSDGSPGKIGAAGPDEPGRGPLGQAVERLGRNAIISLGAQALDESSANFDQLARLETNEPDGTRLRGIVWSASSNRRAEMATSRSVPAIKADAARQLFSISCRKVGWAIIDSGIDAASPAFTDLANPEKGSRIKATYDFGAIRSILNSGNKFDEKARTSTAARLAESTGIAQADIEKTLVELAQGISEEREVEWAKVEPLVRLTKPPIPSHPHGTHVAGILGGCWPDQPGPDGHPAFRQQGVCPDINLYDFRVLGPDTEQTEFAVIAALQFISYLNRRNAYRVIDGINMSLSIAHDVRNYACGYTPVCVEAEARVSEGVVVVAAAGNRGYQQYQLADGSRFASYAASSITDPGNAERVITVGATHRFWPHTYGVSFFSSRGPTGDGRIKPDILAPGERIESVIPEGAIDAMDGTSMAAPHVSGAAALLIARYEELRRQPDEIKRVLCGTATDLGRERNFQGAGMVDVLRAMQSR